jgi:hypothetical protein
MRIAEVVHGVPFANAAHGNIIQFFDEKGKLHTVLKVRGEQCDGVLFLKTHQPDSFAEISWLRDDRNPRPNDTVLEFPDAVLISKEFSQLPNGRAPNTGDLTIHHDGTMMLLSGAHSCARYVDMKTGNTALANAGVTPALVVSRWAIVARTDDATTPLVQFPQLATAL